jgi:hypothetical protein
MLLIKSCAPVKTRSCYIAAILFFALSLPAFGREAVREAAVDFNISTVVDWRSGEISAQTSFNLAQAGLRLPTGRLRAEEMLQRAWPRLFRQQLLSLRIDSGTTLADLLRGGELSLRDIDAISLGARKTPPSLSPDMANMIGRYTLPLENISRLLLTHGRPTEPEAPLIPVPTSDYTGIIIIADRELPVRGRHGTALAAPCLFPRIWDTNMNLIFERTMLAPGQTRMVRYAAAESIFRPTPSGLEGELAALAGPRPLRIFAREVFGIYTTDPVIDRQDALRILSSANNRRLLREGRVIIVLDEAMLLQ